MENASWEIKRTGMVWSNHDWTLQELPLFLCLKVYLLLQINSLLFGEEMTLDHSSILGTTGVVVHILFIILGVSVKRHLTKKTVTMDQNELCNISFLIIPTQSDAW